MAVQLNIPQFLQHLADDTKKIEVNGSTVGECLEELTKRFPDLKTWLFTKDGNMIESINVFVNGESAHPQGLAKPVKDGDELYIVYLIVGG
jgi:molybdopterin converting factor small subunit